MIQAYAQKIRVTENQGCKFSELGEKGEQQRVVRKTRLTQPTLNRWDKALMKMMDLNQQMIGNLSLFVLHVYFILNLGFPSQLCYNGFVQLSYYLGIQVLEVSVDIPRKTFFGLCIQIVYFGPSLFSWIVKIYILMQVGVVLDKLKCGQTGFILLPLSSATVKKLILQ